MKKNAIIVMMLVCAFSWGSVFPLAKVVLQDMSGLSLSIWRFAIAVSSLLVFMYITKKRIVSLSLTQSLALAVIGSIGIGGLNFALFSGLEHTSATNGALIMALSPIVTALLAAIVDQTSLRKLQLCQLGIALSGVLLVITKGDLNSLINLTINRGDVTILIGMLAWSCYTVCASKVSHWLAPLEFSLITMAMGLTTLLIISLFRVEVTPWESFITLPNFSLASLIYIGVFGTVVGYLCWNSGVKAFGSAKASLYFNLVPVFAALVSALMGQAVSAIQLMGMCVVLTGLMMPTLLRFINTKYAAVTASKIKS
ncbi:DMT family transporter [Pseudoalteromonas peptidolytica]|uniref:DMT family transporter n=1 Tax=Pseudoalteromonas peptidolytica TaxID=61150 RepID=UPI00298DE372|nr:DMT family transporter [Pseudoalteromonas peptidolytica]MDW7549022.1 DMT family transporter [Pseudoalteromonas peptidolytica]